MPIDPIDARKVAVAMALGGIAGAAVVQSHHDQKRKSQAEKDDPEGVEWICELVWGLLDDWEPHTLSERTITPMTWFNSFGMNYVVSGAMMVGESA